MSLDVYLTVDVPIEQPASSGIYVREGGSSRELSRAEWDVRFPNREPYRATADDSGDADLTSEVYSANITHNLGRMAVEAEIYTALWRPSELLDAEKAARIREQEKAGNYHGIGGAYEIERSLPQACGRDLVEPLTRGLAMLRADPERFKALNPANGWGNYDGLVRFVENYLTACEQYPEAMVRVSR